MKENDDDLYGDEDTAQHVGNGPKSVQPPGKLDNVLALGKNPKTSRVVVATAGAVVLVSAIVLVGVVSKNRQASPAPASLSGGTSVGATPTSLNEAPDSSLAGSTDYQRMVAATEARRASDAIATGRSNQPLAASVETSLRNVPTPAAAAASASADETLQAQMAASRAAQVVVQQPQAAGQTQPDPAHQLMMNNAQQAMTQLLAQRPRGSQTFMMAADAPGGSQTNVSGAGAAGGLQQVSMQGASPAAAPASAATPRPLTLIGAGTVEAARLDTGVNTDLGGDFGATLVTGRYAGAKLIGTVQRKGDLAQLTCRVFSLPAQGISTPCHAVMLDAENRETATATDVDRKLFTKYGLKPLAAGFAAVADYLKHSGTTVIIEGQAVTTSQPELTGKKMGQIVGGSAAQQVNADANAFDTTPTARVRAGAVVGVFFTQDVVYTARQ